MFLGRDPADLRPASSHRGRQVVFRSSSCQVLVAACALLVARFVAVASGLSMPRRTKFLVAMVP